MFTINNFYHHFCYTNREKLVHFADESIKLSETKTMLISRIKHYRTLIDDFGSYNFQELCTTISPKLRDFTFVLGVENEFVIKTIAEINEVNRRFREIKSESNKYIFPNVTEKVYKQIIKSFNLKVADAIINEGYVWRMGSNCGTLKVTIKPSRMKITHTGNYIIPINWGESTKNKAKLISEGRVPKNRNNPNGEDWLIYYDNAFELWFTWNKVNSRVANMHSYMYRPIEGIHCLATKLYGANREDPTLHLKYPYYERRE